MKSWNGIRGVRAVLPPMLVEVGTEIQDEI